MHFHSWSRFKHVLLAHKLFGNQSHQQNILQIIYNFTQNGDQTYRYLIQHPQAKLGLSCSLSPCGCLIETTLEQTLEHIWTGRKNTAGCHRTVYPIVCWFKFGGRTNIDVRLMCFFSYKAHLKRWRTATSPAFLSLAAGLQAAQKTSHQ